MKKVYMLFITIVMVISCSKDDDSSVGASIAGEWTLTGLSSEMNLGDITSVGVGRNYNATMTFTEQPNQVSSQGSVTLEQKIYMNGTLMSSEDSTIDFNNQFESGQWELSGNTLTMSGQNSQVQVTVVKLTSNTLIFRYDPDEITTITFEFSK